LAVQPLAQKYSASLLVQITFLFAAVPSHSEGRFAIVTNAGRDAVDADVPLTNGVDAYGEVVWS
jgi:hypothetical protein